MRTGPLKYHAVRFAGVFLLLLMSACSNPIGEEFQNVEGIESSETWQDWVVVGKFGPAGPFALVEIKSCDVSEPCSFSHDSQSHTYDKFSGFKLTVLKLQSSQGSISHVVLRSRQKFDDSV